MNIPKPLLQLQEPGIVITEEVINAWWENHTKICSKCKTEKSAKEFNHSGPTNLGLDGLTSRCKSCLKETKKDKDLRHYFGITEDEYLELLQKQGGRCAICKRLSPGKRLMAVDHDHKTRKIRGLLCTVCNHRILGTFSEDKLPEIFKNAIEYLQNPPAPKVLGERFAPERPKRKSKH